MDEERVYMEFDQIEGQLNIFDYLEEKEEQKPLIAVSKVFARAIKQMNLKEWKTFILALTQIKWTEANKNFVRLDKKELAEKIGLKSDIDHLAENLKRDLGKMPLHSFLEFSQGDNWVNGTFISSIWHYKNIVRVNFAPEFMPLFEELSKERNYITMWADDLFQMTTERSILFYEDLRLHSDTRTTNSRIYTTKELKELFNIPKEGQGSYMTKEGHLARTHFEKRVISPLCEDLQKCSMINLNTFEDGGYWEKVYKHGYVVGYRFSWNISDHPRVATAKEVKQIQEKVDKNPEILKVAKDILQGKEKPKKKANSFKNFEERDYDFKELEKKFARN